MATITFLFIFCFWIFFSPPLCIPMFYYIGEGNKSHNNSHIIAILTCYRDCHVTVVTEENGLPNFLVPHKSCLYKEIDIAHFFLRWVDWIHVCDSCLMVGHNSFLKAWFSNQMESHEALEKKWRFGNSIQDWWNLNSFLSPLRGNSSCWAVTLGSKRLAAMLNWCPISRDIS